MKTTHPTIVRPWAAHELETMCELHGIVFGARSRQQLERRLSWQFIENPAARTVPSIHFAAVQGDRVVGSLSSFPARLKLGLRAETILVPCDLLVLPEVRGQGVGGRLVEAHRAACGSLSIGLAYSAANFRLLRKLGYSLLPAEPQFLRPVRLGAWAASRMCRRFGEQGAWARVAQRAAAGAGTIAGLPLHALNLLKRPAAGSGIRVSVAEGPDERFDAIWSRVSPEIPACFVRDRGFIAWRYFDDPLSRHTTLVAESSSGDPLGFLVYRLRDLRGMRVCQLMDVFCVPTAADVARCLVRECLAREEKQVDLFATKGLCPAIRRSVRESLYLDKGASSQPAMLWWQGGAAPPDGLGEPDAWHLAHGDGDEDFAP